MTKDEHMMEHIHAIEEGFIRLTGQLEYRFPNSGFEWYGKEMIRIIGEINTEYDTTNNKTEKLPQP